MASVLVDTIVERILETVTNSYARKDVVREAFKNVEVDASLDNIYDKYLETKNNLERLKDLKATCKSDYTYWSYITEEETDRLIERVCAEILFSKINIDDLTEVKIAYLKAQKLDSIKARIRDEITGLSKYKPNGYKSKIELLNGLLEGNK